MRFGRNFRLSGKVSTGTLEQDDPLLPYSAAPQYEDTPLPRESLDAELETSMYNLSGRAYWRLAGNFDITLHRIMLEPIRAKNMLMR